MPSLETFIRKCEDLARQYEDQANQSKTDDDIRNLRVRSTGKKGEITALLKELGSLSADERPAAGKAVNDAKRRVEAALDRAEMGLKEAGRRKELTSSRLDITLPGRAPAAGGLHPVSRVLYELVDIFISLGFDVAEGPDIESDYYNFKALNFPDDHPARDMQDTLFIEGPGSLLLRTHTSPVQIRTMKAKSPPVKIIAPGTVYRRDDDITHSPMFHQIEGLLVDEGISFANLKAVLELFSKAFFGPEVKVRFRPSFFPFTEPSAEMDAQCVVCGGSGCRMCKQSGWLEILGSGMVHPAVLEEVGYDTERFTGFAFGLGVDRIALLKYAIDDIRILYENDPRFLKQFL